MTTAQATRTDRAPTGRFVKSDDRLLYEIEQVDAMEPFLMTVVGDTDLWLFLSSTGCFTAGRVEAERCIFPYETDDRLHELCGLMGPATRVRFGDGRVWKPLSGSSASATSTRTLRRSPVGDVVEIEETDSDSGLSFRVELSLCDRLGVVRRCELVAASDYPGVEVEIIDGYVNVMPAGVPLGLQQAMSTLIDGYKRSEVISDSGLAVYALESSISDQPQALEALRVNAVWRHGLDDADLSLDDRSLRAFERGEPTKAQGVTLGRRGAYLCRKNLRLEPGESERWLLVADAHLDHQSIADLERLIQTESDIAATIERELAEDQARLAVLLDDADGAQLTADAGACAAHRSNVLFNAMRGGVPIDGYSVDTSDFRRFVRRRNAAVAGRSEAFLSGLDAHMSLDSLRRAASGQSDPQLLRLALEYVPLTFGRRHGDPSRPWNRFRIQVRDDAGKRLAGYEGNWRDIFQNWEAMCTSYPTLLPSIIAKFVNASTPDGHNPYRINEDGIDWEIPEPGHDFAGIGYWGDHQIVYLLRLLERCRDMQPEWLESVLEQRIFSYANVPYRLRPFDQIVAAPRESIDFDDVLDAKLRAQTETIGGDGRLVLANGDEPALVSLIEKLLVPALGKASNLVPGGGIWMNTQRPEWNDANNALAGFGLSMVTLDQLRAYCVFATELIEKLGAGSTPLSPSVASWTRDVLQALRSTIARVRATGGINDQERWDAIAALGSAGEAAREALYAGGPGQPVSVDRDTVIELFAVLRDLCDETIRGAKRDDGLYESYNVVHFGNGAATVERLAPMLEGQVAVLTSGTLAAGEAADLLDALFRSSLYREDQRTFMLYPRVDLPSFMDRNRVPESAVDASPVLKRALEAPESGILHRDFDGVVRFQADIRSHEELDDRLNALASHDDWSDVIATGRPGAHDAFEQTFEHARFTGRSGRMHKYEGLGSVYWHMVSKLLLAAQECAFAARDAGESPDLVHRLREHYLKIRDGLGFRKTPAEFGAVPHEPYSHTPWNAGAQQPGMTGQVKEGVLARLGELGLRIRRGTIGFDPLLLDHAELLSAGGVLSLRGDTDRDVAVPAGAIGFTLCGTPIVLRTGSRERVVVVYQDGTRSEVEGSSLPEKESQSLFARTGLIERLEVETA